MFWFEPIFLGVFKIQGWWMLGPIPRDSKGGLGEKVAVFQIRCPIFGPPRRIAPNKNWIFGFSPRGVLLYIIHFPAQEFSLPACTRRVGRNQDFARGDVRGHAFDIRFLCFSCLCFFYGFVCFWMDAVERSWPLWLRSAITQGPGRGCKGNPRFPRQAAEAGGAGAPRHTAGRQFFFHPLINHNVSQKCLLIPWKSSAEILTQDDGKNEWNKYYKYWRVS